MSAADQVELYLRVLLAFALGGAVGLEREYRGHEAGIRTNALVCAGAAMFGSISLLLGDDRVAAAVVQGIGFLGAGIVFQRQGTVRGVTTAATVWVMTAIGLAVASRLYLLAVLVAATTIVLLELAPASDWVLRTGRRRRARRPKRAAPDAQEGGGLS
ncbi:MgtC/SapB family protein [Tepidiforma sp.]|uniref:MgtC/SapB family protein n=1 Tax=Tepidiforma sp. TaxID=2682230 RepID=UPI002ADE7063|nr:MgtC/SapB family protein [Tepidiforma sp.]